MLFNYSVFEDARLAVLKQRTTTVRNAARGRWVGLLSQAGISKSSLTGKHGPCPGCGGKDRFRFDDKGGRGTWICSQGGDAIAGDGFSLLQHVHAISFPDAVHQISELLGIAGRVVVEPAYPPTTRVPGQVPSATAETERVHGSRKRLKAVRAVCRELTDGCTAAQYLINRGLGAILKDKPCNLWDAPQLRYYLPDGQFQLLQGMVTTIRAPTGAAVTLQQTFLTANGHKAAVEAPRKILPPITPSWLGGAVRLYEATNRLAIAEGVESALAVRLATGWPVWAAVTAGGLEKVVLPLDVRLVAIHADHDHAGIQAAQRLQSRLLAEGRTVMVKVSQQEGADPLDDYITDVMTQGELP